MKEQLFRLINGRVHAVLGLIALILTLYLGEGGVLLLLVSASAVILFEFFYKFMSQKGLTPYHLFLFTPLLLIQYSSINDFRIRFICLFMLVYLVNIALYRSGVA